MAEVADNVLVFRKTIKKLKKENKGFWSFESVKQELNLMGYGNRWTDATIKTILIGMTRVNYTIVEALKRSIRRAKYNHADFILEGKIISPQKQSS